ncbi:hypothetical protein HNQ07_004503 [Deinococcus metalli]|uniref:Uncharacterized protein n=1 Tax=Deinococcus metalli TaxID=1141878 RepID=A0A7W8NTD0_9DEIO|nr:hypothetical protein [Deinococcus metalli]MBB5378993.1 hypothetical protein [Deinococcus metalli]GHF63512.1 hypothetical protein GCM10017781_44330 [Deinococcus metalli]
MRPSLPSPLHLPTALPAALTLTRHLRRAMTPYALYRQLIIDMHGVQVLSGDDEADPTATLLVTHNLGDFMTDAALEGVLTTHGPQIKALQLLSRWSTGELARFAQVTSLQVEQALLVTELDPAKHIQPWTAPELFSGLAWRLARMTDVEAHAAINELLGPEGTFEWGGFQHYCGGDGVQRFVAAVRAGQWPTERTYTGQTCVLPTKDVGTHRVEDRDDFYEQFQAVAELMFPGLEVRVADSGVTTCVHPTVITETLSRQAWNVRQQLNHRNRLTTQLAALRQQEHDLVLAPTGGFGRP